MSGPWSSNKSSECCHRNAGVKALDLVVDSEDTMDDSFLPGIVDLTSFRMLNIFLLVIERRNSELIIVPQGRSLPGPWYIWNAEEYHMILEEIANRGQFSVYPSK
jgi:hypothetical protein